MHQQLGLPGNRFGKRWMRIAQSVYANAAKQIEITPSFMVVDMDAAALAQQHGIALVGREQQFRFEFLDLLQVHATSTSVPDSILVE
jgi:hypothetical protein